MEFVMVDYFSYISGFVLESIGLYEPELSLAQAKKRLARERATWMGYQSDREELWNDFLIRQTIDKHIPPLAHKAVSHLEKQGVKKGVAVDLGCGVSPTTYFLLQKGWKVYAVDSSQPVIDSLKRKVPSPSSGTLITVTGNIEDFDYPENVHLIIANDSIPYTDPEFIESILARAKNALLPGGVFTCSLFPPFGSGLSDYIHRQRFGFWNTTKNVIEAVMKDVDFSTWSVTKESNTNQSGNQFHIFASTTLKSYYSE